jgi:hypothetical protein
MNNTSLKSSELDKYPINKLKIFEFEFKPSNEVIRKATVSFFRVSESDDRQYLIINCQETIKPFEIYFAMRAALVAREKQGKKSHGIVEHLSQVHFSTGEKLLMSSMEFSPATPSEIK